MTANQSIRVHTPAKVNLGLEILGKRDDGYHEIRTVLSLVDITDDLTLTFGTHEGGSTIDGVPEITPADNLIIKAVTTFNDHTGIDQPIHARIMKRIPSPAGLGGASSNAAATLLALNRLHGSPLTSDELFDLASALGSDVPFFLGSATAQARGTGTEMLPLPNPEGWLLIVVPQIDLIAKTAKLYDMITPDDFSDGSNNDVLASRLAKDKRIDDTVLGNAFERPLRKLMPYVRKIDRVMREAGCDQVMLSGSGPAHYALFRDEASARAAFDRLKPLLGSHDYAIVTSFRHNSLTDDVG